jgi:hypothetical protein
MSHDPFILGEAQRHLNRAWHRVTKEAADNHVDQDCPAAALLPQLLDIVAEAPHEPVSNRTQTIRRLICEHSFPSVAGFVSADLQVQVIVRVLETVRNEAIRHGSWSNEPAAMPMFG